MAIPGQLALTTISLAKEYKIGYQPLLLAEITLPDGVTVVRLASENLDSTDGGHQYQGFDWLPRIISPTLGEIQATTDNGIVQAPQITIDLADDDAFLWQYEIAQGWKGSKLVVKFVFWDADTTSFSTDEQIMFVGVCNAPKSINDNTLSLLFTNILNLANFSLPTTGVARRCPWLMPTTFAQRQDGANNRNSPFFRCGYSPDVPGGNARGNLVGGAVATSCDYTWESCLDRMGNRSLPDHSNTATVQIEADNSMRGTGRFGGIRFDSPLAWSGRAFLSGNNEQGLNNQNDAKYNEFVPMVYGTAFNEPPVMNILGEGNSTRFEVLLCHGEIHDTTSTTGPIHAVIVNNVTIPFTAHATDPQLAWGWVSFGNRNGQVNRMPLWDGKGDPYGSMAAIWIVVPRMITESNQIPNVKVLMDGPRLRQWTSPVPGGYTEAFTDNGAWILADLLTWCDFQVSATRNDLDLQAWITAAQVAAVPISYTDLTGTVQTHPRYELGFAIRQRASAADKVKNLLNAIKGMLAPNTELGDPNNGKLQLIIKQTLADQQPTPVPGSNNNTPILSANAAGNPAYGYAAYSFTPSDILRTGPDRDSPTTFRIEQRPISDTPNRLGLQLQDEDFFYAADTLSIVDSEDVARAGQQVVGSIAAEGIVNFDQGKRVIQSQFGEQFRGNPRPGNDSGGTWILEFETSFKGIHLRVGQLVTVTYPSRGLNLQLFRILSKTPINNCERIRYRMMWHEDDWYKDSYGQNPDPTLESKRRNDLARPPFGWLPNFTAPDPLNVLYDVTEKTFGVADVYTNSKNGQPLVNIRVRGYTPVSSFSAATSPPYAPTAVAGYASGTIPAGVYYMALSARGSDGLWTPISFPLAKVELVSPGNLSLINIYWQSNTTHYKLFAGRNPNKLSLQGTFVAGTPASVTINTLDTATEGAPDPVFSHFRVRAKKIRTSGVLGATITAVSGDTITCDPLPPPDPGIHPNLTPGAFVGRRAIIIPVTHLGTDEPQWDFDVAGNSNNQVTLIGRNGGIPDLVGMGVSVGDALIIRSQAVTVTPNGLDDPQFANFDFSLYMDPIPITAMSNTTPIVVTTPTDHPYITGDHVQVINAIGSQAFNSAWQVTVIDPTHFSLDTSVASGTYGGGGETYRIEPGLIIGGLKGDMVLFIAGTGRGQLKTIADNTLTGITIDGTWDVTPDSTSVYIFISSTWIYDISTTNAPNADPALLKEINIPCANFRNQWLWVQAFTENINETKESIPSDSPGRELVIIGTGTILSGKPQAEFVLGEGAGGTPADIVLGMSTGLKNLDAGEGGRLLGWGVGAENSPTGSDAIFDILWSRDNGSGGVVTDSLFTLAGLGGPAIHAVDSATARLFFKTLWQGIAFNIAGPCTLQCVVTQVGSSTPGQRISVNLYWDEASTGAGLVGNAPASP